MDDSKQRAKEWGQGWRTTIHCYKCDDTVHSTRSGEFVCCSCESVFVDETQYYCRMGGDPDNMDVGRKRFKRLDLSARKLKKGAKT